MSDTELNVFLYTDIIDLLNKIYCKDNNFKVRKDTNKMQDQ